MYESLYNGQDKTNRATCTKVSVDMLKIVEDYFSTDAYLTIGNVQSAGTFIYDCHESYLYKLLNNNEMDIDRLKIHVWITLSSGEVVDFTFFKGLSMRFHKYCQFENVIATKLYPEIKILDYIPMLVGIDFFRKIGALVE